MTRVVVRDHSDKTNFLLTLNMDSTRIKCLLFNVSFLNFFLIFFTLLHLHVSSIIYHLHVSSGVQGWRSGESTRLPPMWPGFDSRTRRHMWVEFVGSLLCTERFSPGTPVSPLLKNQHLT